MSPAHRRHGSVRPSPPRRRSCCCRLWAPSPRDECAAHIETRAVPAPVEALAEGAARGRLDALAAADPLAHADYDAYYGTLANVVRDYLQQRFGFNARALTTAELQRRMVALGVDRWQARLVSGLLDRCDAAVYAGRRPDPVSADHDLTVAFEIVELSRPQQPGSREPRGGHRERPGRAGPMTFATPLLLILLPLLALAFASRWRLEAADAAGARGRRPRRAHWRCEVTARAGACACAGCPPHCGRARSRCWSSPSRGRSAASQRPSCPRTASTSCSRSTSPVPWSSRPPCQTGARGRRGWWRHAPCWRTSCGRSRAIASASWSSSRSHC